MSIFRTFPLAGMAFSFLMVIVTVSPASAAGFTDYDIAIQELNKVKKVRPAKPEKRSRKKVQKKEQSKPGRAIEVPVSQPERKAVEVPVSQPGRETVEPPVSPEPVPEQAVSGSSAPAKAASTGPDKALPIADASGINHDPFSYVVIGKRTVLKAVVDSTENLSVLFCRFRSVKGDAWARVPMAKVENTHFTYQAILPALASDARSLRYSFVMVDSQGKETVSREFSMPVKSSLVVPGWQQEPSAAPLGMVLENSSRPLDGYNDPGLPPAAP